MKQSINEIKRMQFLAGLINESQLNEERIDMQQLANIISDAKKQGREIAINDEPVTMWIPFAGKIKTTGGNYRIGEIASRSVELTIDGEPVEMPIMPIEEPKVDIRTPEEKEKLLQRWMDRYGPGGGYETPAGRYTGD